MTLCCISMMIMNLLKAARVLVQVTCTTYVIVEYGGTLVLCNGPSMLPSIQKNGDIVFVEKLSQWSWWRGGYRKGDIVVAKSPCDPELTICKRIHAMSGDRVWMKPDLPNVCSDTSNSMISEEGAATADNDNNDDDNDDDDDNGYDYNNDGSATIISSKLTYDYVKVPRGYVWLQGDNKANSVDSRDYGAVPLALIRGRVLCRVWPLHRAGWLPDPEIAT